MYVKHTIGIHINNRNLNKQIKLCVFVEDIGSINLFEI